MHLVHQIVLVVVAVVSFGADLLTIIVYGFALYGILTRRKAFGAILAIFASTQLHERNRRIRETIGSLNHWSIENKADKSQITALLGKLSGQIKPGEGEIDADMVVCYNKLQTFLLSPARMTESKKQQIIHQIDALLDSKTYKAAKSILENIQ